MILPSLNAPNCGNILRAADTILGSNVPARRKNSADWTIRSEATWKRAERSTTTISSLNRIGMANVARMGRIIAFALALIWSSSFFPCVVKANVINSRHEIKVLNSVVVPDLIYVVRHFIGSEQSSEMSFHHKAMLRNIPLAVTVGVIRGEDENVTVMVGPSGMVCVDRLDSDFAAYLSHSLAGDSERDGDFLDGFSVTNHSPYGLRIDRRFARYAEAVHVNKNEFLTDIIFVGDSLKCFENPVILLKNFLGNVELFGSHEKPPCFCDSVSLNLETRESNDQDIVWTAPKDAEGGIKSPSITNLEIKKYGDTVHIRTIPDVTVRDYKIGQKLIRERPDPTAKVSLLIDKGKYYSIAINDVEKLQSDLNYMDKWTDDAGQQMKIAIDADILGTVYADADTYNKGATAGKKSGVIDLGASGACESVDKTNILDYIVDMGTCLDENDVPETQRWLVFPAIFCGMIKKSDLKDASLAGDGTSIMRNGRLGIIDRFTIYSSNQIETTTDGGDTVQNCIFGHPSAITFASQLTENRVIPNPDDFGDLMEGLHVYGYETIKTQALGHFYAKKA